MPRIKFEDRQLSLIKDSLKVHFEGECLVYYTILGNALGDSEIFDIPEMTAFDSDVCLEKKNEALAKHKRLRDIYQAKIDLFEAEHKFDTSISDVDKVYLTENKGNRAIAESIIDEINNKFNLLVELKQLIAYLEEKTAPKPTKPPKEPHPLSDYDGFGGRLTSPVDTII